MRFDRPIGTALLFWPTMWALWLAQGGPPPGHILFIFISGVIVMRSAGCVINDIADRKFDPHVKRTATRPLASGELTVTTAIILFCTLMLIAALLVWQLNWLSIKLAIIAAGLSILYPFTKRFFIAPQLILGFNFAWGVPMAFSAIQNHVPPIGWMLFFITLLWVIAYDTQYAMADREEDKYLTVHSLALTLGYYDRLTIVMLQVLVLTGLVCIAIQCHLNELFFLSLVLGSLFFFYQQWLIRTRDASGCFQAFLNNHWFGFVLFLGFFFSFF